MTLSTTVRPQRTGPATAPAAPPLSASQPRPTPRPYKEHKPGKVVKVRLRVKPERYTGVCPAKLELHGEITTKGSAEVKYTWASSDGVSWPVGTIRVPAEGTHPIYQSIEAGAPGEKQNGWIQLKVLAPNDVESPQAKYLVACTAPQSAATPAPAK